MSAVSHVSLLAPLEQHRAALCFKVRYEPLDGQAGYCSSREPRIVIDRALPGNAWVATLVREYLRTPQNRPRELQPYGG